jgi:uncharacterized protein (TIGR03067 family)
VAGLSLDWKAWIACGQGESRHFVASDPESALAPYRNCLRLEEHGIAGAALVVYFSPAALGLCNLDSQECQSSNVWRRCAMRTYTILILATTLSVAADDPKNDPVAKDYARLEGTWRIVSLEVEGMKIPDETIKDARLIIKGKEFTMKEKIATYSGNFTIDPGKKPKAIDMKFTAGPEKGNTSYGIYEIDGDNLKICLTITAKDRPTEFAAKAKSGHGFEVLKREKATGDAADAARFSASTRRAGCKAN